VADGSRGAGGRCRRGVRRGLAGRRVLSVRLPTVMVIKVRTSGRSTLAGTGSLDSAPSIIGMKEIGSARSRRAGHAGLAGALLQKLCGSGLLVLNLELGAAMVRKHVGLAGALLKKLHGSGLLILDLELGVLRSSFSAAIVGSHVRHV
jgi:hypothetical protein